MAISSKLYCDEDADALVSWGMEDAVGEVCADDCIPTLFPINGERFRSLLAAEAGYMPQSEYVSRYLSGSLDITARQDAINWILKVSEFYRFHPLTAYLSINYLDRFLSLNALPQQNGKKHGVGSWTMQLLSVACLSVAAKMEETHVTLFPDLQIFNPEFVFDPRTICRMELLLMSALRWRMRALTPFDFISYFGAAIILSDDGSVHPPPFSRSADLILSTHRVVDFLGFRPSVIAASAVLCAASEVHNSPATYDSSIFDHLVSKEMVSECRQQMEEYLIDTCPIDRRGMTGGPSRKAPSAFSTRRLAGAAAP
ncbi:cyclin-D2-1-like [Phalaenopsis equestris]|uniref:cyclin-D2-1-like n=1 Tax=Phalaenopsis equestris TaxID=78828 RepID=UPI0009E39790|nr:cyclin-D2-1-like [Phalaenopsis equestris]